MTSLKNRIVGYGFVDKDQVLENPHNFRTHPRAQKEALDGSLSDLGWIAPVVLNRTSGHLIDGHLRAVLAAEHVSKIPVAYVELSEEEEKEALVALDPIGAMATTDRDRLGELLSQVCCEADGMKYLLERLAKDNDLYQPDAEDPGCQLDRADELQEKWQVKFGQIYEVGVHRIMCGDSTDEAALNRLLGESCAQICVTDPPWNVAYGSHNHPSWRRRSIANDELGEDFFPFARNFCNAVAGSLPPGGPLYREVAGFLWTAKSSS
jgi:hypothetical protein